MSSFVDYRSQFGSDFIYLCAKEVAKKHKEERPAYDAEDFPIMNGLIEALKKDEIAMPVYSAETMVSMISMEMWLELLERVEVLPK
jgi:hypothetical protein